MNRRVGDRGSFPCVTKLADGYRCSSSMKGVYGGEYCADCSCGGHVTIAQYLNCCCDECGTTLEEAFEYSCEACAHYGSSEYFLLEDVVNDCCYSWDGIGFPLVEVSDMEGFFQYAIATERKSWSS